MSRRWAFIAFAALAGCHAYVRNTSHLERCRFADGKGGCAAYTPSLIELIARPEKFDGKPVLVIGFVNLEFEGNGLYVSRADWENHISRNAIWIDPPPRFGSDSGPAPRSPNQEYVIVMGVFNAKHGGHLGMFSGAIEKVTRLDPWPDPGLRPRSP